MKLLYLVALLASSRGFAEEIIVSEIVEVSEQTKTQWKVSKEIFAMEPTWDGSGNPPLDLANAIKKARGAIQHTVGSPGKDVRLRRVFLQPPIMGAREFPNRFVYIIEFDRGDSRATIVLLMSGNVVEPTKSKY